LASEPQKTKAVATPGDVVSVIEEYFPGKNTYTIDGEIIAKLVGIIVANYDKRIITIEEAYKPKIPQEGEIVYAIVTKIRDISITLDVFYIETRNQLLHPPLTGSLHKMNISGEYFKSTYDAYGYGDVLRAKVLIPKIPLILATRGREYGVILARCPSCMGYLKKRGFNLYCPKCKKTIRRKVSSHYLIK